MKLGMNENTILPLFHPDAQELYNICNSLSKVESNKLKFGSETFFKISVIKRTFASHIALCLGMFRFA